MRAVLLSVRSSGRTGRCRSSLLGRGSAKGGCRFGKRRGGVDVVLRKWTVGGETEVILEEMMSEDAKGIVHLVAG